LQTNTLTVVPQCGYALCYGLLCLNEATDGTQKSIDTAQSCWRSNGRL